MRDTKEDIQFSKHCTAKAINLMEAAHERLGWVFENNPEWNSDVKFQLEDAMRMAGCVVACLETWYDDEESSDTEQ